jgi:hypothetical protein
MHERARAVTAMPGRGHRLHWAAGQGRGVRIFRGRLERLVCGGENTLHEARFGALQSMAVWRARVGVATVRKVGVLASLARGIGVPPRVPPPRAAATRRQPE